MRLYCIIDTCSCICLSNAEFRQQSLLKYLNECSNLNYSNEVHIELRDHKNQGLPNFIHDDKRRLRPGKFTMNDYETRMVGSILPSRSKNDKGEIDNFIISADQIHHVKKNSIIFITDDKKAINGVLAMWMPAFPAIKLWTSYEVVLYLYAENVIPSKEVALDMIQTIIAFTAPKPEDRSPKTTNELLLLKKAYTRSVETISKLLK